jgi:Hsp20/alpha crystallin family
MTTRTGKEALDHAHAYRPVPRTGPAHPAGARHRRAAGRDADGRHRQGDSFFVCFDLPGISAESIDLTVEQNVLTVRAERAPSRADGAEMIVAERPSGAFTRQVFLGKP